MEVTKSNFKECLGEIEEAIKSADFLAIDGEFTGLSSPDAETIGAFDTPEERYHKLRKGASQFLLVQFGLAAFQYDAESKKYTAKPFNMYVFPRPFSRQAPDRRFLCQSSSIDFLVTQGFDFNKLFREGLPYLTSVQEQHLKESIEKKYNEHSQFSSPAFTSPHGVATGAGPHKGPVEVPDEQKQFIDDTWYMFGKSSSSCRGRKSASDPPDLCPDCKPVCTLSTSKQITDFLAEPKGESLQLAQCSAFQRKLIYQTARLKFQNVHLETKTGEKKERYIVVSQIGSDEELKAREKAKMEAEMGEVDEAVGFCKVTRMISQSGKLVVGHNMLLDLIHTTNQFFFHLPEENAYKSPKEDVYSIDLKPLQKYEDFKGIVKCVFPRLLDTKLMASTAPFKEQIISTTLGDLHRIVDAKPFVKPQVELPDEFSSYGTSTEFLHEAGYDAYITGLVFIGMKNYLGTFQNPPKEWISSSSPLVEPFINKLFLMRVNDIPYLNLSGADLSPNRDHIFYVSFPKEWKAQDLHHLFAPFGNISLSWLNDTSAFAALYRKDNASAALKALSKCEDSVRVITYKSFKRGFHDGAFSTPTRKRKLSSEDAENSKKEKRSITPIPEEDENEKEEEVEMRSESPGPGSEKKAKKMFDEPEVW